MERKRSGLVQTRVCGDLRGSLPRWKIASDSSPRFVHRQLEQGEEECLGALLRIAPMEPERYRQQTMKGLAAAPPARPAPGAAASGAGAAVPRTDSSAGAAPDNGDRTPAPALAGPASQPLASARAASDRWPGAPHQIVRHVVGLHLFQLVHGHRAASGRRFADPASLRPAGPLSPQQGSRCSMRAYCCTSTRLRLCQLPWARSQSPRAEIWYGSRASARVRSRQQLISSISWRCFSRSASAIPAAATAAGCHQAGLPLLHEQLTQPSVGWYHDLAHQAAGIPAKGLCCSSASSRTGSRPTSSGRAATLWA